MSEATDQIWKDVLSAMAAPVGTNDEALLALAQRMRETFAAEPESRYELAALIDMVLRLLRRPRWVERGTT